ncbi:PD-(D/E)XK nuclease family protein [Quadrisphaera sp. DSM 44207]|uniref:RecB family exonuclease n=1 Tax=Quadrisphaera sp. DSM 44207 TaxID=1881057 RepID=UPI000B81AD93
MPARLFSCTPSKLTAYLACPRRYRMTYLDRPSPPRGPAFAHTSMGAAVHLALARWWSEPPAGRTPAAAVRLVRGVWSSAGFRDEEQSAEHRGRAERSVAAYTAALDPHQEPVGVERTVATRTAVLAVSGRVDRLDRRGDELVVVDYKLGRRAPEDADARSSLALALYALAAGRTLRTRCRRVELHHLPSGTRAVAEHDEASVARKVTEAESLARDAVRAQDAVAAGADPDAAFPATPSRLCAWCDLRASCPAGRATGPAAKPWAALEP